MLSCWFQRASLMSAGCGTFRALAMRNELELAERVAQHLRAKGAVDLHYITAEFAPFTSQFKPDLLFIPSSGLNANVPYFVEVQLRKGRPLGPHEIAALSEHRRFAIESTGIGDLRFSYVTDVEVDDMSIARLSEQRIRVWSGVSDPDEIARLLLAWAM